MKVYNVKCLRVVDRVSKNDKPYKVFEVELNSGKKFSCGFADFKSVNYLEYLIDDKDVLEDVTCEVNF